MIITLDNVVPAPLKGVTDSESQVWDTHCSLDTSKKYKVFAPSGKGKSTLVHAIYGLRSDFDGAITLDQTSVTAISPQEYASLRQDKFSVIFQDLRLFLHLTALENLQVKAALTPPENRDKIEEYAKRLQVSHLLNKECGLLSYGERQRIAIIRAMIQPFQWLMMDEPFSHLDEDNIQRACKLITEVCEEQQAGFVIVSLGYDYFFEYDQTLRL